MALRAEQLGRTCRRSLCRAYLRRNAHWCKKQVARKARRLARRLLEDAPKRVTRGWVS